MTKINKRKNAKVPKEFAEKNERTAHKPTLESRDLASMLYLNGCTQEITAAVLGISVPTLWKYYKKELEVGGDERNARVASSLYTNAISGDVRAQIFWMKTRAGWRETNNLELSGSVEIKSLNDFYGGNSSDNDSDT